MEMAPAFPDIRGAEALEGFPSTHRREIDPKLKWAWPNQHTALLPDRYMRSSRFEVSHLDYQPASIFGFRCGHGL
jgi:hypothetical protein